MQNEAFGLAYLKLTSPLKSYILSMDNHRR